MEDSAAFASDTSGAGAGEAGAVLDFWRRFAMDDKKAELERSCVDMREMKTASISGRKRLNEITKAFRAKPKEEQLATVTEVLKAYQEEIDQLSRRSKFTESTFFGLYKALYEAPDPADCIQGLMEVVTSGSTHQLEIERLKAELAQYDEEFQKLKNQDITIRRLEDQLQEFRDQNEDKINEEVAKRMAQLEVQTEERVTEMRELQRAAEKRLGAALDSVKEAQQSADRAQSQLYELSARDEQRVSALRSENSLLAESCERLTIRLAEAERELSAARAVGGSLSRNASKGNVHEMDADHQEEALTLQMMVTELREEIRQKEDGFRTERQRLESSIRDSAQQLAREKEYAAKLKLELSERPTKMELMNIKKQLKTIQKIVFHVEDEDDDGANEVSFQVVSKNCCEVTVKMWLGNE